MQTQTSQVPVAFTSFQYLHHPNTITRKILFFEIFIRSQKIKFYALTGD